MIIKTKGKDYVSLNEYIDFINYIKQFIFNLKEIKNDSLISFFEENKNESFYSQSFKNRIKDLFYMKTILNKSYWMTRGWSNDESTFKVKEIQSIRSDVSKKNRNFLKNNNYQKWCESLNTKKEFYIKQGYSELESISILKERQNTFSLEKCILKYGDEGYNIWQSRQSKWVEKIKNKNFDKNSSSAYKFISKFGNDWIIEAINQLSFIEKDIIKKLILKNNNNFLKFIEDFSEEKNCDVLGDFYFIYNSKILQSFFKKNKNEMIDIIINKLGISKTIYGNYRYFNNHICRSNGEYAISKNLKNLNIDYIYEKKYPNSKFICDFYIPKYDLYIEYLGMIKSDYLKHININLYNRYVNKYEEKEKFCKSLNVNYIFENDVNQIIEKIKKYEYKNK